MPWSRTVGFEDFSRQVELVARMDARSDLDKMFQGYSIALHTLPTRQGLNLMNEAIEVSRQGFPVARVLRATILVFVAQEHVDLDWVRKAEDDLDHASRGGLADNPRHVQTRLMAKLTAFHLYRRTNPEKDAKRTLESAASLYEALGEHGSFLFGNHQRLCYLSSVYDLAERDDGSPGHGGRPERYGESPR